MLTLGNYFNYIFCRWIFDWICGKLETESCLLYFHNSNVWQALCMFCVEKKKTIGSNDDALFFLLLFYCCHYNSCAVWKYSIRMFVCFALLYIHFFPLVLKRTYAYLIIDMYIFFCQTKHYCSFSSFFCSFFFIRRCRLNMTAQSIHVYKFQ